MNTFHDIKQLSDRSEPPRVEIIRFHPTNERAKGAPEPAFRTFSGIQAVTFCFRRRATKAIVAEAIMPRA